MQQFKLVPPIGIAIEIGGEGARTAPLYPNSATTPTGDPTKGLNCPLF